MTLVFFIPFPASCAHQGMSFFNTMDEKKKLDSCYTVRNINEIRKLNNNIKNNMLPYTRAQMRKKIPYVRDSFVMSNIKVQKHCKLTLISLSCNEDVYIQGSKSS